MYYGIINSQNKNEIKVLNKWEEVKPFVLGEGNKTKKFKKFETINQLFEWVKNEKTINIKDEKKSNGTQEQETQPIDFYVDGSFHENKVKYASIKIVNGKKTNCIYGVSDNPHIQKYKNIAAELKAVVETVNYCKKNNIKEINLYYDYEGIEKWVSGEWKTKNFMTQEYKKYMITNKNKIKINFIKIKAHSGNYFNEMVDKETRN